MKKVFKSPQKKVKWKSLVKGARGLFRFRTSYELSAAVVAGLHITTSWFPFTSITATTMKTIAAVKKKANVAAVGAFLVALLFTAAGQWNDYNLDGVAIAAACCIYCPPEIVGGIGFLKLANTIAILSTKAYLRFPGGWFFAVCSSFLEAALWMGIGVVQMYRRRLREQDAIDDEGDGDSVVAVDVGGGCRA